MSEAKWVTRSILLIYLTTTGVFLAIFFVLWYDKLYDELVVEKSRALRDTHRTIVLSVLNARYTPIKQSCQDISNASNIKFALIDSEGVLCSTLSFELENAEIKALDEDRYKGKFRGIYKNSVYYTDLMRTLGYFLGRAGFGDEAREFVEFPSKDDEKKEQNDTQKKGEKAQNLSQNSSTDESEKNGFEKEFNEKDILDEKHALHERRDFYERRANLDERQARKEHHLAAQNKRHFAPPAAFQKGYLYTFIEGENVSQDLLLIRLQVLLSALASFALIALVSRFLVKIALKPLESKITMLNSFIKDFTHEINTPLSVILLSIEQLEKQQNIDTTKFARMKLAAKTLSQTYSDLIFLTFPDTISNEEERIVMKEAIRERLEYFRLFFERKQIALSVDLQGDSTILASKSKINKMLDNLISNAIKYNKKGGFVSVNLKGRALSIKDSGYGIDEKNLTKIFERYARFNSDQGGFGIGLSLVKSICKEYHIEISCHSKLGEGSEFVLKW